MITLAGPLAVSPMEAARYTISGVPNFPERKDHLKEFGYKMLENVGDAVISDEDIGAKALKEKAIDKYKKYQNEKALNRREKALYKNMGGYAEEKPMVSLAGEFAETTPMPAPNYANIDAPQIQRGSGGNMAKDMAMKVGMKMAMSAMGIPPVFNEGGYVPQYANEGMMPNVEVIPAPAPDPLDSYYSELGDQLQDKPPVPFMLSPMLNMLGVGAQDSSGFDYGQMPVYSDLGVPSAFPPSFIDRSPDQDFFDNGGALIAPPQDYNLPQDGNFNIEENEKRLKELDKQIEMMKEKLKNLREKQAIDNENMFKEDIERGYVPGAGYASLPMDKDNITKLMS